MGILKNALTVDKSEMVSGQGYELGHSISSNVMNMFGDGGKNINVLSEYSGYAWKAINLRAKLLSSEDLYVERQRADKWVEDTSHEFNAVLEGGDEDDTRDQSALLENYEKSMNLFGEAFWYFSSGDSSKKPFAVYPLDPSKMTVMVANDRIKGYVYQKDGEKVLFDTNEIMYDFDEDPRKPFRGTGPMQAAGLFIRSARYTMTYVNNFLENNAIPAGVVVAKDRVSDPDWELFKDQWTSKYGGIDNAGKTGFLRGTEVDFVKTGMSLGEVDFEKIKSLSRDDIMLMFGVSKPMYGMFDDINRASAVTARQLAALTLTQPALMSLKRKLTKKVRKWYGKEYRVAATNPVPEDDESKLAQYDKGVNRWLTINEAREAYGLKPIAGGDELHPEYLRNVGAMEGQKSFLDRKTVGKVVIRTKQAGKTREDKEAFRIAVEKVEDEAVSSFYKAIIPFLKNQEERVKNQIEPKKLIDSKFDVEAEAEAMTNESIAVLVKLAEDAGRLAAAYVGKDEHDFKLSSVVEQFIRDQLKLAAIGFTEDTQGYIAQAITDGLNEGESVSQIANRIGVIYEDVYKDKAPGYRLERIARTETSRVANKVSVASYRESGVISKKEWYANPGACDYCRNLHGSVISLDAIFVPKGASMTDGKGGTRANDYQDIEEPPGHPGCRCRVLPVIDELEDI